MFYFSLYVHIAALMAVASAFCLSNIIGTTTITPSVISSQVGTSCILDNASLLHFNGSGIPTLPLPGIVELGFVNGLISRGSLIRITGPNQSSAQTRVPLVVLVSNNSFSTGGAILIRGCFPPNSNITVSFNTFVSNMYCPLLSTIITSAFVSVIHLADVVVISLFERGTISLSDNNISTNSGATIHSIPFVFNALSLYANASVLIQRNTIRTHGVLTTGSNAWIMLWDGGAGGYVLGNLVLSYFRYYGGGARFAIEDNWMQATNDNAGRFTIFTEPPLIAEASQGGSYSISRNYFISRCPVAPSNRILAGNVGNFGTDFGLEFVGNTFDVYNVPNFMNAIGVLFYGNSRYVFSENTFISNTAAASFYVIFTAIVLNNSSQFILSNNKFITVVGAPRSDALQLGNLALSASSTCIMDGNSIGAATPNVSVRLFTLIAPMTSVLAPVSVCNSRFFGTKLNRFTLGVATDTTFLTLPITQCSTQTVELTSTESISLTISESMISDSMTLSEGSQSESLYNTQTPSAYASVTASKDNTLSTSLVDSSVSRSKIASGTDSESASRSLKNSQTPSVYASVTAYKENTLSTSLADSSVSSSNVASRADSESASRSLTNPLHLAPTNTHELSDSHTPSVTSSVTGTKFDSKSQSLGVSLMPESQTSAFQSSPSSSLVYTVGLTSSSTLSQIPSLRSDLLTRSHGLSSRWNIATTFSHKSTTMTAVLVVQTTTAKEPTTTTLLVQTTAPSLPSRWPTRETTTFTRQTTNLTSPGPTTALPVVPLVPLPAALSSVGFGFRYIEYSPVTAISGLVSGLSLLFTESMSDYHARRFLIPISDTTTIIRHLLSVGSTSPNASFIISTSFITVSKCSQSPSTYSLNDEEVRDYAEMALNTTGFASDFSSFACGDQLTGYPSEVNVARPVSAIFAASGLGGYIKATLPTINANPCRAEIQHAGSIYSSLPFKRVPLLSYAFTLPIASWDNVTASTFVSTSWKGSNSNVIGTDGFESLASVADAVFIGDVSNTQLVPTPALQRKLSFLLPNPTLLDKEPIISNNTHKAVACTVADQKSFTATLIPLNVSLSSALGNTTLPTGQSDLCFTFDTIDDLHLACQRSATCFGFTTIRMAGPKELPLCLYDLGIPFGDVMRYPRIFYAKPTDLPTCDVKVQRPGTVAVYIQQTDMNDENVIVRVNGNFVAKCGGVSPFSNGFKGVAGRCKQWALCAVSHVPSQSIVTVTTSGLLDQSGCDNSLGVIVEQVTFENDSVIPDPPVVIPRLNVTDMESREISKSTSNTDPIRLFVYRGGSAALDVLQTGYACSSSTCSSQAIIEFRAGSSCQRCGGRSGFYGGLDGVSDVCNEGQFCGDLLALNGMHSSTLQCEASSATNSFEVFTGVIQVAVNMTSLVFQSGQCSRFHAIAYSQSLTSAQTDRIVPLFPMIGESAFRFSTLLAVPSGASTSVVATKLGLMVGELPLIAERILSSFAGPRSTTVDLYYVQWDRLTASPQNMLNHSSIQVCLVDHSMEAAATCTFYIPKGSTTLRLEAAQTDFAIKRMTVDIRLGGSLVTGTTVCGGGASDKFGFGKGQQEQCATFEACVDEFMYEVDSDADSNEAGTVTVALPPQLRSYGCNFTAIVFASFDRPPTDDIASCPEYECPKERRCIPFSSLCDSVQDCASNADERTCQPLVYLPTESFCVEGKYVLDYSNLTFEECQRKAVANGSTIFSLKADICTVIASTAIPTIMADPDQYVCSDPSVVTYIYLPDRSAFGLCRDTIQCYGHGTARKSSRGLCECDCREGYYGANCEEALQLEKITFISLVLESVPDTRVLNFNLIADVLRLNSELVSVSCESAAQQDATSLRVDCSLESLLERDVDAYTHYRRLLDTSGWAAINASMLSKGQPSIKYLSARTIMSPEVDAQICNISNAESATSFSANCSLPLKFDRLALVVRSSLPALSISIVSGSGDSLSSGGVGSNSRDGTQTITCSAAYVDGSGGCIVSKCDLDIGNSLENETTIRATNVNFGEQTLFTAACDSPSISVVPKITIGDQPTATGETVDNELTNFVPFLASGIVAFIIGTLLSWLVAFFFRRRHSLQYRQNFLSYVPSGEKVFISQLQSVKAHMLVHLACVKEGSQSKVPHNNQLAVIFMLTGFICAILASVLVVYYSTAYELQSNFSLLYEEYTDYLCDQSPTANMPRRIFSVGAGTPNCERMSSTGEQVGQAYGFGVCEGTEGSYTASFKMATSLLACRDASEIKVANGTCVPLSYVDGSSTRNVYVRLTCSTTGLVAQRQTVLRQLTTQADVFITTDASVIPQKLRAPSSTSNDPPFRTPYLAGSVLKESTSNSPGVVVSQAVASDFDGDLNTKRLVVQAAECTFTDTINNDCPALIDAYSKTNMSNPQSNTLAPFSPSVPDVPMGKLFGGFGTSELTTWLTAGPQAHRYYGIAGTSFDFGRNFQGSLSDDDGYAVSLWLRADRKTLGFAYAVTDAFENVDTMQIYPVERLARIIDSGGGGGQWFNESHSVYHGLYVNGPGQNLAFAYASPNAISTLTLLEYDLQAIGAARVMNGQWHHIAVTFVTENSQVRAQLVVDGQTSYTKPGWSHCVSDFPKPISEIGDKARVYSPQSDRVYPGGLLAVGYFNGGVYRLQAHTGGPTLNTDLLLTGTPTMRDGNPFERMSTLALGATLVSIGGVLLIFLVVWGARMLLVRSDESSTEEFKTVSKSFYQFQKQLLTARKQAGGEDATSDDVFRPICLFTALKLLNVTPKVFSHLTQELTRQQRDVPETLCLLLYQSLRKDYQHTESFSTRQWNEEMQREEGDTQEDVARCGGSEVFRIFFSEEEEKKPEGSKSQQAEMNQYSGEEVVAKSLVGGLSSLSSMSGGGGASSSVVVLGSVLSVFQGMHVWSTSIELPSLYDDYFSGLFSFVSIDFTAAFPSVPTIVTPLIQVAVGLLVLSLVIYFVLDDRRTFDLNFAVYIWRRDELEAPEATDKSLRGILPATLLSSYVDDRIVEGNDSIPIKPPNKAADVDMNQNKIQEIDQSVDHSQTSEMPVGVRCPYHDTLLTFQSQTAIWPYFNRPVCCVSVSGVVCGSSTGKIFSCGFEQANEEGERTVCSYALCEYHCRHSVSELLLCSILTPLMLLKRNGIIWLGCVAMIAAAGAAYTPFIKTALMIVGCHPYYQCEFENCWSYIDQKFALAAFLSITVLILFGIGYPVALFLILRQRKSVLETTFSYPEYQERYSESGHIRSEEWQRFVLTDNSALSGQYRDLTYKWIYFPPILVLLKILPLLPAVLMEPRTFGQRLVCGIIEIGISLFIFSVNAYQSPLIMMSLRASQVHQLILLGLQSLDLVVRNDGRGDLSVAMVAVTLVYLAFIIILLTVVMLYPFFDTEYSTWSLKRLLTRHGLKLSSESQMYRQEESEIVVVPTTQLIPDDSCIPKQLINEEDSNISEIILSVDDRLQVPQYSPPYTPIAGTDPNLVD